MANINVDLIDKGIEKIDDTMLEINSLKDLCTESLLYDKNTKFMERYNSELKEHNETLNNIKEEIQKASNSVKDSNIKNIDFS